LGSYYEDIRDLGAEIIAVAVTATFSQMAFASQLGLEFPMVSDWDREVSAAYGVQYASWKGHRGLAKRALFVVDRAFTIRYAWTTDDAEELPELEPAIAALRTAAG